MTEPSPAELPVRRLTLDDLPACLDLAEDRGWQREEHKWRLLLSVGQGYGIDAPDRPGGLLAAFVLTPYGTRPDGSAEYTCVSMVLVAERRARQGLGRRMMRHAIAESGSAVPFLTATPSGRPLYEELGFRDVGSLVFLSGTFTGEHPPPSGTSVRAATAADLPAVLALDAVAFGTDRTELLTRLPSFASRFVVAENGAGDLTGFAAAWPNPTVTVVGPVVADDLATARALTADLCTRAEGPVRFDVDTRHEELHDWLRAHGLDGDYRCSLMIRSADDLPGDIGRRFAPYSVALG